MSRRVKPKAAENAMPKNNGYIVILQTNRVHTIKMMYGDVSEELHAAVGGYIELMPLPKEYVQNGVDCFANEEGHIYGLPYNHHATVLYRKAGGESPIVGNVALVKRSGVESVGFTYTEAIALSERIATEVRDV